MDPPARMSSGTASSKKTAFVGTSTPASSDSLYCPRLYSPKSSAARHTQLPSGSAYGT